MIRIPHLLGGLALTLGALACGGDPAPWERALEAGTTRWDPAQHEAGLPEVIAALRAGQPDQAAARARTRAAEDPPPEAVHHYLGLALLDAGRPEEARPALEEAVRRHPGNAEAHAFLAEALIDLGELAAAEPPLDAALHLLPDFPFLKLLQGRLYSYTDRQEAAAQALFAFLPSDPYSARAAEAHSLLARLANAAGQPDAAARHQQVADLLVQANQFLNAHAGRLQSDPTNVEALVGVAMIRLNLFRNVQQDPELLEQARGSLERVLEIAPETVVAHYNLGFVATLQGRADEAFAAYDRTLALEPEHVAAALNGARLARLEGDLDRSQRYLDQARPHALESEDASRFRVEEALLVEQMGQKTQAIELLRAASEADPGNPLIERETARLGG